MNGYKRYARYKKSQVDWVNEIPQEWIIKRIKYTLQSGKKGIRIGPFGSSLKLQEMDENNSFKVYGQENIINNDFNIGKRFITANKFNEMRVYQLFPGDIIISMMGTIGECKVVPSHIQQGIMDSHLIRLRTNVEILLPRFLEYLIDSTYYIKEQMNLMSKGSIMSGLNSSIIKDIRLIIPSINEQQIIISFLNQKTSELDDFISDKEKLIKLLQEKKQAIIRETVTKGLNPDVKMKASGIDKISDIPKHWEVTKIKNVAQVINGSTPNSSNEEYWDGDIKWITPADIGKINDKYIYDSDRKITYLGLNNCGTTLIPANSVVLTTRAPIGNLCINSDTLCTNQGCKSLIPKTIDTDYLYYYLKSSNELLNSLGSGTTFMELSTNNLKNFLICYPPLHEQKIIANFLDRSSSEINGLINDLKIQIEKLKEYRQSLISEVVTGKIDVRGVSI